MKKTILPIVLSAGLFSTIHASPICPESQIAIAQTFSGATCLSAKDCDDHITYIKRYCALDRDLSSYGQGTSVQKAINNYQRRKDQFISNQKEQQRLSKLPGVRLGMTTEQVLKESNWGKPNSINRTTNSAGIREQWVYKYPNYLYFHNNVLVSIQN